MITIRGNNNKILSVELSNILSQIEYGNDFYWKILWIDGMSKKESNFDMLGFENIVNKSKNGYNISFKDLQSLSLNFYQLIELVLIGNKDNDIIDKELNDENLKEECDFFIELVDSSYWEITTKNVNFKNNLIRNLEGATL